MNESLQQLETKVENQGATSQGRVSAVEWNVLVAAVKQLDSSGINDESLKKYLQQYQYITRPELSGILNDAAPDLSGVVNTSGEQDVVGIKNFVNGLKLSNKLIRYDADKNVFIFPGNILAEGGVAWNTKLEGFEEQTITAAVQVDWKTIGKNEAGELYVIDYTGGGSGGGSGSDGVVGGVTIDEVKNYLTNEGYATQVWVSEQGFLKSITSSMVTSALSYTPFNAANFTKNNIKNTLGISDWALEGVKPSYEFSEITNKPTTLSGYGITDAYTRTQVDSALAKKWTQDDSLIANWDSAYSWGNHASAGYAKPSDIQNSLSGYLPIGGIAVGAKTLKSSATSSSWTVAAGNGINVYNSSAKQRYWFGFSLPEGSPYATTKWVFGASDGSDKADGEIYAKHISLGYGDNTTTGGYALRANGDAKIDGSLTLNGKIISYNASKNAFVFPANAIFEGGVAWNASIDGFTPQTIMDAIFVDDETISKANGYLEFIGETGGLDETELANYLTTNNYAKKSDIPSLSGYATQAWVTSKGYITGITSTMVTSALGYTPYNAANFTKANIKSTLGISDWALSAISPFKDLGRILSTDDLTALVTGIGYTQAYAPVEDAYDYGQIINFNGTRGHTQIYVIDGASRIHIRNDWNKTGLSDRPWREILTSYSYDKYALPLTGGTIIGDFLLKKPGNATIIFQPSDAAKSFWFGVNTSDEWFCTNAGYTATYKILHSGNYSSYALPKDGIAAGAKLLKASASATSWTVAAGNGINCYNANATKRYWFGWSLPDGSPYATSKWIFGASNQSSSADGEVFAKSLKLGFGSDLNTTSYALHTKGDARIDGALNINGKSISYNVEKNALVLSANLVVEGGVAWNTKLEGFDQQTVTAAVNVDGTTITKTTSGALQLNPTIAARIAALEARVEQLHPTDS